MAGTMVTGATPAVSQDDAREEFANRENDKFGAPDPAQMYPSAIALRPAYKAREEDLTIILGLSAKERTDRYQAHTRLIDAAGLEAAGLGRTLFDLALDAELAERRGEPAASAADAQRLKEEARGHLADTYGPERAEWLLARAQRFIAEKPELAALMRRANIGNRKDVIAAVVEHVNRINFV